MELKLLATAIQSREAWEKLEDELNEDEISIQAALILKILREYYTADRDAQQADPELIEDGVLRALSNPKHADQFKIIFERLKQEEISPTNVARAILGAKEVTARNKLAAALSMGKSLGVVEPLLDDFQRIAYKLSSDPTEDTDLIQNMEVSRLVGDELSLERMVKLAPASLNAHFRNGGIPVGSNVLVFARTEIGKTALCCNLVRGFLFQGLRVLYLSNEDSVNVVLLRIVNSLTGMAEEEVRRAPEKAQELLNSRGYSNLVLKDITPGTMAEISSLVKRIKPDVFIVDQVRNLTGANENRVVSLEQFAQGCRSVAKIHNCIAVIVAQAHVSAHNKLVLGTNDVDGSKTGIPGAVDVMIGLGANDSLLASNQRCISLPKNKHGSHDHFLVKINPMLSRID